MVKNLKFGLPDGRVWATLEQSLGWHHSLEVDDGRLQWAALVLPHAWILRVLDQRLLSSWLSSLNTAKCDVSHLFIFVTVQIWILLLPSKSASHPNQMILTLNWSVDVVEELGLVVTCDCGVRIHISWQIRQLVGQVSRSHLLRSCLFFLLIWMLFDFLFCFLLTLI